MDNRALVDQAVNGATGAIGDANAAIGAAQALLDASRGRELSTAVDRISAKVNRGMNDIAVDVSAVKQTVAGIGGFAAIFVPGIDGTVNQAIDKFVQAPPTKTAQNAALANIHLKAAMSHLADAITALVIAQSWVRALFATVDVAAVNDLLKRCSFSGVATALVMSFRQRHPA